MRKREGAGGDVFTGNDRNAAEPVPCYARRVRGSDWKDEELLVKDLTDEEKEELNRKD